MEISLSITAMMIPMIPYMASVVITCSISICQNQYQFIDEPPVPVDSLYHEFREMSFGILLLHNNLF